VSKIHGTDTLSWLDLWRRYSWTSTFLSCVKIRETGYKETRKKKFVPRYSEWQIRVKNRIRKLRRDDEMAGLAVEPSPTGLRTPPSDGTDGFTFIPEHEQEVEVENFINNHPLTKEMRAKSGFAESRPHIKMPPTYRSHNLTGSTLLGPGRVVVPPIIFSEDGGKSLVSIQYLGHDICGHPGVVHGGMLATILDESMARCCFAALPHKIGMTANLNINYRAPTPAGSYVVFRGTTTKVEGRKAWVEGRLESLSESDTTPVVFADATALFISPKQAAVCYLQTTNNTD
jgi:3'-phosphoadenosine 5'-phosphosulfate synthase